MEKTDVLIIGSGAGAAPVAFRLAEKGYKVTLLEKGQPWDRTNNPEDEFAELYCERHRPSEYDDPTVVSSNSTIVASSSRVGQAFYLSVGGTVRYTGTSWRLRPEDFKKLSSYGTVPDANLADWPLDYKELESYYTDVEKLIGISGVSGADPTEPPRSKNHLLPPLKEDEFQGLLTKSAKKLGFRPFPIPVAIHSQSSAERGAGQCLQCGWCSGFPCRFLAKSSVEVVVYPRLSKNTSFQMKMNSYVTRIVKDKNNPRKVTGAEFIDLTTGKTDFVEAKIVVVAASAIQSSRLLLYSEIPNDNGLIGKNLMFHIEAKGSAVFEGKEFHQAFYKKVGIHDLYFPKKSDGFINHRSLQSGSKAPPVAFSLSRSGFGKDFVEGLQNDFLKTHEIQCMVEDVPQLKNCVTLSADKKDPWGIPSPHVEHSYHNEDRLAISSLFETVKSLLENAGGSQIQVPKEAPKSIADRYTWHLMGATRMGKDPETSVVNPDSRFHEVNNLFVTDGSVFPTSGGLNPTLTIQAMSLRAGDRIHSLIKEGKV